MSCLKIRRWGNISVKLLRSYRSWLKYFAHQLYKSANTELNTRSLVYTEFILVRLWRKPLAYINTLQSVPWNQPVLSNQCLKEINGLLSLTWFEPMRLAIFRLLVRRVKHSTTPPKTHQKNNWKVSVTKFSMLL